MNEANNTATVNGNYNSIPTSLTSNTSVVNLIDGLAILKAADKKNWSDGYLTYTITVSNQTNSAYENPVITDVIDTTLVEFVAQTVVINEKSATSSEYNYNNDTHTLTINLSTVEASTVSIVKFSVKKKYNGSFILKNIANVYHDNILVSKSNVVTVLIRPEKYIMNNYCNTPYWRG